MLRKEMRVVDTIIGQHVFHNGIDIKCTGSISSTQYDKFIGFELPKMFMKGTDSEKGSVQLNSSCKRCTVK